MIVCDFCFAATRCPVLGQRMLDVGWECLEDLPEAVALPMAAVPLVAKGGANL